MNSIIQGLSNIHKVVIVKVFGHLVDVGQALDDRVHEASVAQIAQSTNTRLRLLTQTPISVSPRSPTEVVPIASNTTCAAHRARLLLAIIKWGRRRRRYW